MDFTFSSKEELYVRVKPALLAKVSEMKRVGYLNIKCVDIWNYLILNKWKDEVGLTLFDIVDDILNCDCNLIVEFVEDSKKNKDTHNLDKNLDLI